MKNARPGAWKGGATRRAALAAVLALGVGVFASGREGDPPRTVEGPSAGPLASAALPPAPDAQGCVRARAGPW
jgi:hypothetical protein